MLFIKVALGIIFFNLFILFVSGIFNCPKHIKIPGCTGFSSNWVTTDKVCLKCKCYCGCEK